MRNRHDEQKTMTSDAPLLTLEAEKTPAPGPLPAAKRLGPGRWWRAVKRYPVPFASMALMLVSLVFWLAGRPDLADWTLLAVALLGGIPLLWETVQQLLHKEFGVDVIALLAIAGSVALGPYLAGALIVLMLSGGEALEALYLTSSSQNVVSPTQTSHKLPLLRSV